MAAFVQGKGVQSSGAVASVSVTLDSATTSGNMLAATTGNYRNSGTGAGCTVTDNKSNTWVKVQENIDSNWTQSTHYVSTATPSMGSSHQFTNTVASGSGFPNIVAIEISGIDLSDRYRGGANGTSTSTAPDTTAITTVSGDFVIGGVTQDGAQTTITPNSGWTQIAEDETVDSMPFSAVYAIADAATETPGWTLGASRSWRASGIALKPGAAATQFVKITGGGGLAGVGGTIVGPGGLAG